MARASKPYTFQAYMRERTFLDSARDVSPDNTPDHQLARKRQLLANLYGPDSKIRPLTASREQIHSVFQRVYHATKDRVDRIEASPIYHPLAEQLLSEQSPAWLSEQGIDKPVQPADETIDERIAIRLDGCSEATLEKLIIFFGSDAPRLIGDYAVPLKPATQTLFS